MGAILFTSYSKLLAVSRSLSHQPPWKKNKEMTEKTP
jgi:hypothetical protein